MDKNSKIYEQCTCLIILQHSPYVVNDLNNFFSETARLIEHILHIKQPEDKVFQFCETYW